MLNDPNIEIFDEVERLYLEFDEVMENLGSNNTKYIPPWVVTNVLDPRYFDTDQILERLKYANRGES
jgi:hypothetical protein